jgi:hypothetical protein
LAAVERQADEFSGCKCLMNAAVNAGRKGIRKKIGSKESNKAPSKKELLMEI